MTIREKVLRDDLSDWELEAKYHRRAAAAVNGKDEAEEHAADADIADACVAAIRGLIAGPPSNDTRALEVAGAAVIAAFAETEFATGRCRALLDWSRRALAAVGVADLAYRNLFAQYTKGERTLEVAALRKQRDAALEDALDADREVDSWKERTIEWRRKYDARRAALEVAMGALEEVMKQDPFSKGLFCAGCLSNVMHKPSCLFAIARRALAALRSGVAPGEATRCKTCGGHELVAGPLGDGEFCPTCQPAAPAAQRRPARELAPLPGANERACSICGWPAPIGEACVTCGVDV